MSLARTVPPPPSESSLSVALHPDHRSTAADPHLDQDRFSALANWRWLATSVQRRHAILAVPGEPWANETIANAFARVDVWRLRDSAGVDAETERVDCVAVPCAECAYGPDGAQLPTQFFDEVRRVLRPGGVYVGIETIRGGSAQRLLGAHRSVRSLQVSQLRRSGFRDIRAFYLVAGPRQPRHFVPASTSAVVAFERVIGPAGWRGALRRAVATSGLHAALFQHRFVIAYA